MSITSIDRRYFVAGFVALLGVSPALAARLSAEEFVERLGTWVVRLAASGRDDASLKSELGRLFSAHVDMDAFVRFALGRHYRQLTDEMKRQYRDAMLDYVAGMFVKHRKQLVALEVRAKRVSTRGSRTLVVAEIVDYAGRKRPMQWRLANAGGKYRVIDVNLHNIWLAMRMRERFASTLKRSGGDVAVLLQKLRQGTA